MYNNYDRLRFICLNLCLFFLVACNGIRNMNNKFLIRKLTNTARGHMLHHNSVFSADGQWIVFDGRNDEKKIGETTYISIVSINGQEEHTIYETQNPSMYGPGVGAASFSPTADKVIFIHGLLDANENQPYDITRRFGMAVDIQKSYDGIPMDARDVVAPYTLGSLRGGSHSHCWSPDGTMVSFTYNDAFVDPDLRMVGVMIPSDQDIVVPQTSGNHKGTAYAVILSEVVREPEWGTNQISKAFDECWLATDKPKIAFQGNTKNLNGEVITEIYTIEVNQDLIRKDPNTVGKIGTLPQVPKGIVQKRISFTEKGLSPLRHWLRSSPDGRYVYALAKDDNSNNQIVQCTVETGEYKYISNFPFSISSPININYDGDKICFYANNKLYLFDLKNNELLVLVDSLSAGNFFVGSPVFSRQNDCIAFNVLEQKDKCVHIYVIDLKTNN